MFATRVRTPADGVKRISPASTGGVDDLNVTVAAQPDRKRHSWIGGCALAAALAAVTVFVGSWFVADPSLPQQSWAVQKAMFGAAAVLWLAALILGALSRRDDRAQAAVVIALAASALFVYMLVTGQ